MSNLLDKTFYINILIHFKQGLFFELGMYQAQ